MSQKNLWNFFQQLFGKSSQQTIKKPKNISAAQARSLQTAYINNDKCVVNPPYQEIAKQLYSSKEEVFNAACFYLEQIGIQKKQDKEPIIQCLQACAKNTKTSDTRRQQINQTIANINAK